MPLLTPYKALPELDIIQPPTRCWASGSVSSCLCLSSPEPSTRCAVVVLRRHEDIGVECSYDAPLLGKTGSRFLSARFLLPIRIFDVLRATECRQSCHRRDREQDPTICSCRDQYIPARWRPRAR